MFSSFQIFVVTSFTLLPQLSKGSSVLCHELSQTECDSFSECEWLNNNCISVLCGCICSGGVSTFGLALDADGNEVVLDIRDMNDNLLTRGVLFPGDGLFVRPASGEETLTDSVRFFNTNNELIGELDTSCNTPFYNGMEFTIENNLYFIDFAESLDNGFLCREDYSLQQLQCDEKDFPCCLYKDGLGFVEECLSMDIVQCHGDNRCRWCKDEATCGRTHLCGISSINDLPTANPTEISCCLSKRKTDSEIECQFLGINDCRGNGKCKWCTAVDCTRIDECVEIEE